MDLSNDGFYVPFVDDKDSCIECGICEKVCSYMDNEIVEKKDFNINSYSAYNKNSDILKNSTSGGVAIEIAERLSKLDYNLCGVEYDSKQNIAKHFISNNLEDFQKSKGSKYIQSYTYDAFNSFKYDNKYLVFGTPCQIDSLKRYVKLKKWDDNFIFVDFFCHGIPSYNLWIKYLNLLREKKFISKETKILFRDKKYGWHNYTIGVYNNNKTFYSRLSKNDLFLNMFLGNYCLNETCYNCKFRLTKSSADIRLGDFWGNKFINNEHGVSGIITFTKKGDEIINSLNKNCYVTREDLKIVLEGQMRGNSKKPRRFKKIMMDLRNDKSLKSVYLRFGLIMIIKNLIPRRIKNIIKTVLNR